MLELIQAFEYPAVRNPASAVWDITAPNAESMSLGADPLRILATRPDRGRWLGTVDLITLMEWLCRLEGLRPELHVEVKRYRKFAHHTLYEETFNGTD